MRSIDSRLNDSRLQYWNKYKDELMLYQAKMSYKSGSHGDIESSDGNTIIERIARQAFEKGFNCGTAELFSVMSRSPLTIPASDDGGV